MKEKKKDLESAFDLKLLPKSAQMSVFVRCPWDYYNPRSPSL